MSISTVSERADAGSGTRVPFALPSISEKEIDYVVATLRSGWLTTGPKTREFEEAFARTVGARHGLAVNSATGGLHLAVEAGPGSAPTILSSSRLGRLRRRRRSSVTSAPTPFS